MLGMLRSHRRNSLARAVEAWRSAGVRRVQDGRRLQSIALRTAHRQRVFFLGKAWSRIVWAAGEREAARPGRCAAKGLCGMCGLTPRGGSRIWEKKKIDVSNQNSEVWYVVSDTFCPPSLL